MTFYPQPTSYECGPFALKHALALLGVAAEEHRIGALAGTTTGGTDEVQLGRAAAAFGFDLPTRRADDPDTARRLLREELAAGRPVLACVDQWSHWVTIAEHDRGRFVVVDSADDRVFDVVEWPELERRWGYLDRSAMWRRIFFDLNPLVARAGAPQRARVVPELAARLGADRRELARDWSAIVSELLPLSEPARGREDDPAVLPVSRLLAAHRTALLDRVDGRGPSHRAAVAEALDRVRVVAGCHDLRVLSRHDRDALGHVEAMLRRLVGSRDARRRWRSRLWPVLGAGPGR